MKMYLRFLSVLLYFDLVISVQMNYVYNDNPDLGYIAAITSVGSYSKTKLNGPRKYYVGNTNQKYMKLVNEEVINSLFSVMKNAPKPAQLAPVPDKNNLNHQRNIDNNKSWQTGYSNMDRMVSNANAQTKINKYRPAISKDSYRPSQLPSDFSKPKTTVSQERRHYDFYGMQDKFNKVNHKTAQKVDEIEMKKANPQPPTQEVNKTVVVGTDKSMYKVNIEHNDHTMSKLFGDITQKAFERYQRKQEFRKRDTMNKKSSKVDPKSQKSKINGRSELKFHKDHNVKFLDNTRHAPARIGKNEENDKPYALFYRSHENFDQRDFYTGVVDRSYLNNAINDPVDIEINVKDKADLKNDKKKTKKITNVKKLNSYYNDVIA